MKGEEKHNVDYQMGNQGHSEENYFQFKAWTEAGIVKDITQITEFMNNGWRWHGMKVSDHFPEQPIPENLNWDKKQKCLSANLPNPGEGKCGFNLLILVLKNCIYC